jgi:hypothetical protein
MYLLVLGQYLGRIPRTKDVGAPHIRALLSPFPTKLHMSAGRWPGDLAWGHESHRKDGGKQPLMTRALRETENETETDRFSTRIK